MLAYFVRRLLATILLVVAVSSAAFIITRLAAAHAIVIELGLRLDQKEIQRRTHELKLDQPILVSVGLVACRPVAARSRHIGLLQQPGRAHRR